MSILDTVRGHGRHRGKTPAQLRRELDTALCELVGAATRIGELWAERNQLEHLLDQAGIELSGIRLDLDEAERELTELRAFKANVTAVSQPAGQRDIDPADQATAPIDVRPLWERFGIGPGGIPQQRKGA
ncbi:hypothetical protein ABZ208_13990 [Streptomyces sp. NPDC006208]|uniref:hypothetical protein n=1 Tax=Streptomyces sp. NPDC006208 TaxID=3156734 RepID=UPI0033B6330D